MTELSQEEIDSITEQRSRVLSILQHTAAKYGTTVYYMKWHSPGALAFMARREAMNILKNKLQWPIEHIARLFNLDAKRALQEMQGF